MRRSPRPSGSRLARRADGRARRPSRFDMRWSANRWCSTARLVPPRGRAGLRAPPAATIASAARRPVSSAWPMPSPVITSVAAAASPTNSTSAAVSARPRRCGPGSARRCADPRVRTRRRAPRRLWARCSRSRHSVGHVADRALAVAEHAEPDVDPIAGQRERPGVAGQQVGLEPHDQSLAPPAR